MRGLAVRFLHGSQKINTEDDIDLRTMLPGTPEVKPAIETGRAVTIRAIVLCAALLFSVPVFAQANTDVIVIKNGDRFTCEIKGLSAGVLSVKVNYVDGDLACSGRR